MAKHERTTNVTPASEVSTPQTLYVPVNVKSYKRWATAFKLIPSVLGIGIFAATYFTGTGQLEPYIGGAIALVCGAAYYWITQKALPAGEFSPKLSGDVTREAIHLFKELGVEALEHASQDPALPSFAIKVMAGNCLVFVPSEIKNQFDYDDAKSMIVTIVTNELSLMRNNSSRQLSWE